MPVRGTSANARTHSESSRKCRLSTLTFGCYLRGRPHGELYHSATPARHPGKARTGTFLESKRFCFARLASFLGNARSARMNNPSTTIKKGVCRRSLLKTVPAIAGAIISTTALAESLFAQTKLTHEAAKYQDSPKDGQQCSGCVQFVAPASCKVVEDPVAASGWCQLFIAKPA